MTDQATQRPTLDPETLAFAQRVFGYVRTGNADAMAELLGQGLPANLRNEKGDSLLMLAGYHGHREVVRLLLDHGADTELGNDRGQMPLGAACFKGDEAVVTLLLDGGAALDGHGPDGRTALMLAAMFDRTGMVDLLLARGADPDRQDAAGATAADLAVAMGARGTPRRLRQTSKHGAPLTVPGDALRPAPSGEKVPDRVDEEPTRS